MSPKYLLCAVLVAVVCHYVSADPPKPTDPKDKVDTVTAVTPAPSSSSSSGDLSLISQNLMNALSQGGTVALGLVVLAAMAAMAMPMFGFKYCQLFNTCENSYSGFTAYQNDAYGQYPQYANSNNYQKRSVDYMGPVLHMLKVAYDKYGQVQAAKKS